MEEQNTNSITHVSYSQYAMFLNCPLSWKLQYIDGHKERSDSIDTVFGTAMHETIQHWLKILYNEPAIRAKTFDTHGYLKERLIEGVKKDLLSDGNQLTTEEEVREYYNDGCNILDHVHKYAKDWFLKSYELIGVEVPLELLVAPGVQFRGFLDIVFYHRAAKTIYIYDLKTSRWGWKDYQKKDMKKTDQLLLYKKYYSQKFGVSPDNIKIEFIILKRKVVENAQFPVKHMVGFEPSHGSVSMKRASERFEQFLELFNETGEPNVLKIKATPSESACKYCPFRNKPDLCSSSFYKTKKV